MKESKGELVCCIQFLSRLSPRREPAFNVSNLTWNSYHRNCLLWRNGPKWLDHESSNLLESRLLRGREGNSQLVHALLPFLLYFPLSSFYFYFLFFILFLFLYLVAFLLCYFLFAFFALVFSSPPLSCTAKALLYCLPWWVLLFYPLITFGLVWVSFLDHPLVCRLLSQLHYPALATPCLNS